MPDNLCISVRSEERLLVESEGSGQGTDWGP